MQTRKPEKPLLETGCRFQGGEIDLVVEELYPTDPFSGHVSGFAFAVLLHRTCRKIGHLTMRLHATEDVIRYAGHVGYGIDPEHRGHHYAYQACRIAEPILAAHGMDSVILTCNPDNQPSIRTIERLGAVFIERVDVPPEKQALHNGACKHRYAWPIRESGSDRLQCRVEKYSTSDIASDERVSCKAKRRKRFWLSRMIPIRRLWWRFIWNAKATGR